MKLITRDTDYALRALVAIAASGNRKVCASELTRSLKAPGPFMRKILQRLDNQGVLSSCKGKGGGFMLAMPPEKIFLLDIMKIFQGDIKLNECLFRKEVCPNQKTCFLHKKIRSIEKHVIFELKGINLALLMKHNKRMENATA